MPGPPRFSLGLILCAAVLAPAAARAQTTEPAEPEKSVILSGLAARPNQVRGDEINPAQEEAVTRGLAWLARAQDPTTGGYSVNTSGSAITALAGLAFMAQGNLPDRGKYAHNVERCLRYILDSSQASGLISGDESHGPMYGHGFATLFLGEIYGMTSDESVKEKLELAVRLIERTQSHEGGWRYKPMPLDADISVTICEVMALRAARDAGIKVDKQVIDNAIDYVRRCQNPDGGFSYVADRNGGSGFARSAAGVASLYYAGVFEGDDLTRGLAYIRRYVPVPGANANQNNDMEGNFFYGNYYAVQAMFLAGGTYWSQWYPAIRDTLIRRQTPQGNWSQDVTDEYATAIALIILQMPNRYLPVFNGKGPGG